MRGGEATGEANRVVEERREADERLAGGEAHSEAEQVAGERAVRVGALEVDDGDELREEDDVDEVRAQEPEAVDAVRAQCHPQRHAAHAEDRAAHHPEDLALARLETRTRTDTQGLAEWLWRIMPLEEQQEEEKENA